MMDTHGWITYWDRILKHKTCNNKWAHNEWSWTSEVLTHVHYNADKHSMTVAISSITMAAVIIYYKLFSDNKLVDWLIGVKCLVLATILILLTINNIKA